MRKIILDTTKNLKMKSLIKKYGITLRYVEEKDAEFIVGLRTNESRSRFISSTSSDIENQIKWIKEYKERESNQEEFYFIAYDHEGEPYATYRLYNKTKDSIEIGSYLSKPDYPNPLNSIKLDVLMKEFVFEDLKFDKLVFEVRKKNRSVVKYHKLYNPLLEKEDEMNYYFTQHKTSFEDAKGKIKKLF